MLHRHSQRRSALRFSLPETAPSRQRRTHDQPRRLQQLAGPAARLRREMHWRAAQRGSCRRAVGAAAEVLGPAAQQDPVVLAQGVDVLPLLQKLPGAGEQQGVFLPTWQSGQILQISQKAGT